MLDELKVTWMMTIQVAFQVWDLQLSEKELTIILSANILGMFASGFYWERGGEGTWQKSIFEHREHIWSLEAVVPV